MGHKSTSFEILSSKKISNDSKSIKFGLKESTSSKYPSKLTFFLNNFKESIDQDEFETDKDIKNFLLKTTAGPPKKFIINWFNSLNTRTKFQFENFKLNFIKEFSGREYETFFKQNWTNMKQDEFKSINKFNKIFYNFLENSPINLDDSNILNHYLNN